MSGITVPGTVIPARRSLSGFDLYLVPSSALFARRLRLLLRPIWLSRTDLPGSAFYTPGPLTSGSWSLADASSRFGAPEMEHVSGAFVGDLDADGRSDVAIGDDRDDTDDTNSGKVWVVGGGGL